MTLDEIGENSMSVFCVTDKTDCCRFPYMPRGSPHNGNWFFPNGNRVHSAGSGNIYRTRGRSAVTLHRRNNAQTTGIFRCEIPDAAGYNHSIYVGVYHMNSGSPMITSLMYNEFTLTLKCTSTGGPVTTVTWRKNGEEVGVDGTIYYQSQNVVNTTTAEYENTLSSSDGANLVGTFTCTVTNSRGSSTKSVTLNGELKLCA